jgi:hypothetical protein
VGIGAQKLDTIESITRICCALRAENRPHRGRYSTRFVERIHVASIEELHEPCASSFALVPEQAKTQRTSGIGCSVNLRDTPFMPPIGFRDLTIDAG